jgi:hypothetical protein
MQTSGDKIFKGQLMLGLDLGDRSSSYCVLDEAGEIILEQKRKKLAARGGKNAKKRAVVELAPVVGDWRGLRTDAQ